jgi:hypothetical protein
VIFAILFQVAARDASASESAISALHAAISALESKINCLENSLSSWDIGVVVSSAVVVIGVGLEIFVIRQEWNEKYEDWALGHFGIRRDALKPSIKDFRWAVAAVLLVTLGIAGEFGIGLEIRGIDSRIRASSAELRSKSDQLLALTTQLAGDAATSARAAHQELDEVQTSLSQAKRDVNSVKSETKEAKGELAQLKSLESARHIVDDEPLKSLKLKGQALVIGFISGDTEAQGFCESLYAALKDNAGMKPTAPICLALLGSGVGVSVEGPNFSEAEELAQGITNATHALVTTVPTDKNRPASQLTVIIGGKPAFWFK